MIVIKNKHFVIIYVLCAFVSLFNTFFFVKDQLFFDISDLPDGKLVYSSLSPSGDKSVFFYLVNSPEGDASRVELISFDDDMSVKKRENIYWEVGKSSVAISWKDNDVITIDDQDFDLSLGMTYDCRRKNSFSQKW